MKIGIFGGAFNPIHNGHLNLAQHYYEQLKLDKMLFVPTSVPPHKVADYLVSREDRLTMLQTAIAPYPYFDYTDMEFKRSGKSYTYDTLCELKQIYKDDELYLVVGSDQFFYFEKWHKFEDILNMVTVVTAARELDEYNAMLKFKAQHGKLKNTVISNFDVVVASSTDIRNMVVYGKDISALVPSGVNDYIKEHKLYV